MNEYEILRKTDGARVAVYSAEGETEQNEFPSSDYEHVLIPAISDEGSIAVVVGKRRLTKLEFIEKLGDAAFVAILQMAKSSTQIEAWVEKMKLTTPDPDGTSVDLDDERTQFGVAAIGSALVQMGVVEAGWADGVLA